MRRISFLFVFLFLMLWAQPLRACETCTIAFIGKREKESEDKKNFISAKVLFEGQDWEEIRAREGHELHDEGHHVHNKQDEEIIHTMLTAHIADNFDLDMDIPYVTRHFIEIDSHAHLGENQTSRGLGDITITGDYRLIQDDEKSFGIIAGIKVPSGETDEHNSFGGLIEPELQPGTGSTDYIFGLAGSVHPGPFDFSASTIYVYKTEGEQDFRFGDVLSVSLFAGRTFELNEKSKLETGLILNNQIEKKQNNNNGFIKDSGGYTMLIGPQVSLDHDPVSMEFSYLAPAVQNLGGVHQKLDGIWTGGLKLVF